MLFENITIFVFSFEDDEGRIDIKFVLIDFRNFKWSERVKKNVRIKPSCRKKKEKPAYFQNGPSRLNIFGLFCGERFINAGCTERNATLCGEADYRG